MSANKKKAKRRTAKAMQNLRKTPEKAISSITETKNPIIRSYGIDEYKDEEYDDEDDGLCFPKYCQLRILRFFAYTQSSKLLNHY